MLQIAEVETEENIKVEWVVKREKNVKSNFEMGQCQQKADY